MEKNTNGFTLIEVILTSGMIAVLGALVTINIFGAQKKAQLTQVVEPLIADMKSQQTKAMAQETVAGVIPDGYGIRLETDRYILFSGTLYNPSEAANQVFPLEPRVTLQSVTFPGSVIVFVKGSGEIAGFVDGSNTIVVRQIDSNETKTIQLNRYGIITAIN